jgi:hypothetical protein
MVDWRFCFALFMDRIHPLPQGLFIAHRKFLRRSHAGHFGHFGQHYQYRGGFVSF